jgi:hypothetical protein
VKRAGSPWGTLARSARRLADTLTLGTIVKAARASPAAAPPSDGKARSAKR